MRRSCAPIVVAVLVVLGGARMIGSDHIDGPRTTADPAADLTDLFAFRSPANAGRTVLIANVFAFAGDSAFFSNAVNYTIAMRPVKVAGLGSQAHFQTGDPELRFTCQFEALEVQTAGEKPRQRGGCTMPGDRTLQMVVDDEAGASTADGAFRVFAGLRSDAFYDGWGVPPRTAMPQVMPNVVQDNNVLSIVIEFDTRSVLTQGSLFAVIAETTPRTSGSLTAPPRIDWVGRPEMTNFRLKVQGEVDLRDLWNQETPFAIDPQRSSMYRARMLLSLELWDKRDGRIDWPPAALEAETNVFLDDFLLIDVAKPTTDESHLEIERSTIDGKPYATGGGRTLDANVMDIMISYHVNHGNGPLIRGGATVATQPGGSLFPYARAPNKTLLTSSRTADVMTGCEEVWKTVGRFDGNWHPLVVRIATVGTGIGQLRRVQTADGSSIVEKLERLDNSARFLEYSLVSGLPVSDYAGRLAVKDVPKGCQIEWRLSYRLNGQASAVVQAILNGLLSTGLAQLRKQFGAAPEGKEIPQTEAGVSVRSTSGTIAVANLESSTRAAWNAYLSNPRLSAAQTVVDHEAMRSQFLGAVDGFDQLADLVRSVLRESPRDWRAHLLAARFDASLHRFAEASSRLDRARSLGGNLQEITLARLSIWQATGARLEETLAARRHAADTQPNLTNLALLAAALIDAGKFEEADATFANALRSNRDVSPFPLAWVCFQRGVLWAERTSTPDRTRARRWYEAALAYLPQYAQARVHLAELLIAEGELAQAEALLGPPFAASDPEVAGRLAQVLAARGKNDAAHTLRLAAKRAYERLLHEHELAFADHAAEFYLGIGNEPARALTLARRNLANRATPRAFALAYAAAIRAGDRTYASAVEERFQQIAKPSAFESMGLPELAQRQWPK